MLNAELEPIREKENRAGLAAYGRSALEALLNIHLMIELNPRPRQGYELVVPGPPSQLAEKPAVSLT